MNNVFLWLLKTSYYAAWIVLPAVVLRLLLRKWPKWVFPVLWGAVGFRLLLPFSIESPLSLIPRFPLAGSDVAQKSRETLFSVLAVAWIVGASAMLLYGLLSYLLLRRKLRTAIRESDGVYRSEYARSPFILGMLAPRIYLPFGLLGESAAYVIAHEKAHIRRKDHWWKPIGFGILCLYWFHPAVWIAYLFLCRDIEYACDESVVRDMSDLERTAYSQALLSCASDRPLIAACPLSFLRGSVPRRIRFVLAFRKAGRWVWAAVPVLTVFLALCFMTVPKSPKPHPFPDVTSEEQLYGAWHIDRVDYRTYEYEEMQTLRGNQIDHRLHLQFEPDGVVYFLTERNHHETVGSYRVFDNVVTISGEGREGAVTISYRITATYNPEDDTLSVPINSLCTEYFARSPEPEPRLSAPAEAQGSP